MIKWVKWCRMVFSLNVAIVYEYLRYFGMPHGIMGGNCGIGFYEGELLEMVWS